MKAKLSISSGIYLACIPVLIYLVSGCKEDKWTEFHGNSANDGYANVHSNAADINDWAAFVGSVYYSSPAVADDGTIYVGTTDGNLVAVNSNGSVKWYDHLVGSLSSPTLGKDGNIYISNIQKIDPKTFSSCVFCLKPGSTTTSLTWWYAIPDNGYTTASPKVWSNEKETYTFVPVHTNTGHELFVLDKTGALVNRTKLACPQDNIIGGYSWEDFGKVITGILTFGISTVFWSPFEFKVDPVSSPLYNWMDPTVAIAEINKITNPGKPVVVVAPNTCPMEAFEWDPGAKTLTQLWMKSSDDAAEFYSSPAITTSGSVVIGRGKNVTAYDLMKGNQLWDYDAGSEVKATPAIYAGTLQTYIVSEEHVDCLEDGKRTYRYDLSSPTLASPLVTIDRVYVSTPQQLLSFLLDLTPDAGNHEGSTIGINGGFSSPAISADGVVYVVETNGILMAVH
jgi:outer membrane protein assembly factor BamB